MPARTLNPKASPDPQDLARTMTRVAGYFDDPIARVKAFWGPLDGISRRLTLVVVDRQGKRYPPSSFLDKPSNSGAGRWLVSGYLSLEEFGAPIAPSFLAAAAIGRTMTEVHPAPGNWFTVMTDERGVYAVDLGKSPGQLVWCHTGVIGLLQSRPPIAWSTGEAENVSLS